MSRRHTCFELTHRGGVAVAALDVPGRSMNVVDDTVLTELAAILDEVLADPDVAGLVLASGKPGSFGGGADLTTLPDLAADPGAPEFLARTHALMTRMLGAGMPLIAAIDGYALGGALEVALGCGTLLATDRAVLGLPESTLGLIPGGGGTQLVLRRVDPVAATELMVSGRQFGAVEGLGLGLVDEIVPAGELLTRAVDLVREGAPRSDHDPDLSRLEEALNTGFGIRRAPSVAAQQALLACVCSGLRDGREAGLASEREEFLTLLRSDESAALIHLFHAETAARRRFRGQQHRPRAVGVVGAGQMGAGIAATAAGHGLAAVVRDIDTDRIAEAQQRAAKVGEGALAAWTGTTAWQGFGGVDVAVEAVYELPELKREALALVDGQVAPGTLITTNTSAIQVASLADAVSRPEDFLGTHFFSPVEKMPLVELVPHDRTSADALDRAGALAQALGKVPVVVADYPGFFTSRVYARWILEGLRLLIDGANPADVERGALDAGFPLGPLQACDEITLELVREASLTQVAERVLNDRADVPQLKQVLEALIDAGHQGKRFGAGFYRYVDGRRDGLDPAVPGIVAAAVSDWIAGAPAPGADPDAAPDTALAGERLLLAFVTEALLCWDDGTLCHPDDGDVASVLGIGFPRALGGPFHWVDRQGAAIVVARCRAVGEQAFPVSDTLAKFAQDRGGFSTAARRRRPGPTVSRERF